MRKGTVEVESVNNKKFRRGKKKKMKTKTKIVVLVEIAIVLCSLFLVAIPAIAAQEQNQAVQKASANEVTTASEGDYVLGIYGNANEDETIDMGDVVYTKLAIFGKKPKTELCDAKYDGLINVLDVIQTKLIILGKEKELTVIDSADRIVTVNKPVERMFTYSAVTLAVIRTIKATDKIVAVSDYTKKDKIFYPEFADYPSIGGGMGTPDYEAILKFQPDTIIRSETETTVATNDAFCKKMKELNPDITVVRLDFVYLDVYVKDVRMLGYILDRRDEAEEFIDFYEGYMNTIEEKVRDIPEEDKPRVYYEVAWRAWQTIGGRYPSDFRDHLPAAGGKNIFSDLSGSPRLDPEEVMKRNPEVIIKQARGGGYAVDDITGLINIRDGIMGRPELANVAPVKDGRVYIVSTDICCCGAAGRFFLALGYMAKWLHPEIFEDLDPQAFHQEYLTRFQGLDYDLDKRGAFVYPEPS